MRFRAIVLILANMGAGLAVAQDAPSPSALQQAHALYGMQAWAEAAESYAAIATAQPKNGAAWMQLGHCRLQLGEAEAAFAAFVKADEAGFLPWLNRYNAACAKARAGQVDAAFDWLDKAIEAGYDDVSQLASDADLAPLREDARFAALRDKADRADRPCAYDDRYAALDFWIGEWDVYDNLGHRIGANRIERTHNDCMVVENWTSYWSGQHAKSFSYFDAADGLWRQHWVTDRGSIVSMKGELEDGVMVFRGQRANPDGTTVLTRMTLRPLGGGRVEQSSARSNDGGETWTTAWTNTFRPRAAPAAGQSEGG